MESQIIDKTTIYAGGDSKYWNQYGKSFVKSFKHFNPEKEIHIHLCNPTKQDIEDLLNLPCNYSYELIEDKFLHSLSNSAKECFNNPSIDQELYNNLKYCSKFYDEEDFNIKIFEMMKFTSYACKRFIKLSEIWTGNFPVIAYDIDSICRGPIDLDKVFSNFDQGCLSVKGQRFVVSMVAFKHQSDLLYRWGESLKNSFSLKKVYNFLDQDTFVKLSKDFNVNQITREFCDHTSKNKNSVVITGKGQSKYSELFQEELKKWR